MYHCAQLSDRQREPKQDCRTKEGAKPRDKLSMDTHNCAGWLNIIITDELDHAIVSLRHELDHQPYWNIELPQNIKDFIHEHAHLSLTTQVSKLSYSVYVLT